MNHDTFERVRALVKARAAIVLSPGQEYLVESRIEPIAKARGFQSVDALCKDMNALSPELQQELVEAMTTNETSFFRDGIPFDVLRDTVLPQLIARRTTQRKLRIWCAAASTGQEPYSIALILREHFPALNAWDVQILATDLSRPVLAKAASGRFRQVDVSRGLSADFLAHYFRKQGDEFELDESVRKLVRFDELNLIQSWPQLPTFDLIFLRNVLIYFDTEAKRSILHRAHQRLASDGYLFLGGSETLPSERLGFERLAIPRAGCYRISDMHRKSSWPRRIT